MKLYHLTHQLKVMFFQDAHHLQILIFHHHHWYLLIISIDIYYLKVFKFHQMWKQMKIIIHLNQLLKSLLKIYIPSTTSCIRTYSFSECLSLESILNSIICEIHWKIYFQLLLISLLVPKFHHLLHQLKIMFSLDVHHYL